MTAPAERAAGAGLVISGLTVRRRAAVVLDAVSVSAAPGETVAVVGESGAGKTTLVRATLGLLDAGARRSTGRISIDGVAAERLSPRRYAALRLRSMGYVPQDPGAALDPLLRVRTQLAARIRLIPGARVAERMEQVLRRAGIDDPDRVLALYPHQLSGGYRQRVLIALALVGEPRVLLADEATSALDPETRDQVLDQVVGHARAQRAALLLVTHDIAVAARRADRVVVLRDGRVVDAFSPVDSRASGRAPYARELFAAARMAPPAPRAVQVCAPAAVELRDVVRRFPAGAIGLDGVSLRVGAGETVGLVGRSGAGKTTVARVALGLDRIESGAVHWNGVEVSALPSARRRALRRTVQYVAQSPWDSLDPRLSIGRTIAEPLRATGCGRAERGARVVDIAERVGLPASMLGRRPHELSGGQRQRVAIARALVARPAAVVLDEPTAALDAITRSRVLALLSELQDSLGVAYLLISHDSDVVARLSHRVVTLAAGRVVDERCGDGGRGTDQCSSSLATISRPARTAEPSAVRITTTPE